MMGKQRFGALRLGIDPSGDGIPTRSPRRFRAWNLLLQLRQITLLACFLASVLTSGESITIPGAGVLATVPTGWNALPAEGMIAVLAGPGRSAASIPRMTLAGAAGNPMALGSALRSSLQRVADGCQFIDDDEVPLGGRIWRRMRVRFAVGPSPFGQSIWIGTVVGHTVVIVLSAPEDDLTSHIASATALLSSLHAAPEHPSR